MKFAFVITLTAIGVSFLLPSDPYKAALFFACAILIAFIKEPGPAPAGPLAEDDAPEPEL